MFNIPFLSKRDSAIGGATIGGRNIKLIVGLGNPGEKYKNTYHNVGFMFVDYLATDSEGDNPENTPKWKNAKDFKYAKADGLILAKSNEFMNNSGRSVKELLRYFALDTEEILIVHDDSDISLGEYKISFARGSAGHKGVDSVIKSLRTDAFLRIRIGIGQNRKKAGGFVLEKIEKEKLGKLEDLFSEIKTAHLEA